MTRPADAVADTPPLRANIRLGVVSFVNTLPLIDGLDGLDNVDLQFTVPSLLLGKLIDDEVDIALCSSIDYHRSDEPLVVLPVGLLGCDGPTLTVRLYSKVPLDAIDRVHCDTDSHASVVLMQILLKEMHGIAPDLIEYDAREHVADNRPVDHPETMLLIGDKVVTDSPPAVRYPHQLDLGAQWVEMMQLPFVFALWMAKRTADEALLQSACAVLDRQRRHNMFDRLDRIIARHAEPRKWPRDLAADYLKEKLSYEFTDHRRAGLELFYAKAVEHGLLSARRPLEVFSTST